MVWGSTLVNNGGTIAPGGVGIPGEMMITGTGGLTEGPGSNLAIERHRRAISGGCVSGSD